MGLLLEIRRKNSPLKDKLAIDILLTLKQHVILAFFPSNLGNLRTIVGQSYVKIESIENPSSLLKSQSLNLALIVIFPIAIGKQFDQEEQHNCCALCSVCLL